MTSLFTKASHQLTAATNKWRKPQPPFLTRNETLAGIWPLIPPPEPFFIKDRGLWQAGEWNYFLWQRDNLHAIFCSSHDNPGRTKYFVKNWEGNAPTEHGVKRAIQSHAEAMQHTILENGVITKRGYKNETHIWCVNGLEVFYKRGEEFFYLTHHTGPNHREEPLKSRRWMPPALHGIYIPIASGSGDPERRAEISIMNTLNHFVKNAWAGNRIHESTKSRAARYVIYLRLAADDIAKHHARHHEQTKEGLELAVEFATSAVEHLSTIGMLKLAYTGINGAYHILNGSQHDAHKLPGCPEPDEALMKEMLGKPKYTPPLRAYFLPANQKFLATGHWIDNSHFGEPGLISGISTVDTLQQAGLARVAILSRGTEVRPYFDENASPGTPLAKRIGAMRAYKADGLIVTFTGDGAYFQFDEARRVYKDGPPLPKAIMEVMPAMERGEIFVTKNLLGGQLTSVSLDQVNREFVERFGVRFRAPESERPSRVSAAASASHKIA